MQFENFLKHEINGFDFDYFYYLKPEKISI